MILYQLIYWLLSKIKAGRRSFSGLFVTCKLTQSQQYNEICPTRRTGQLSSTVLHTGTLCVRLFLERGLVLSFYRYLSALLLFFLREKNLPFRQFVFPPVWHFLCCVFFPHGFDVFLICKIQLSESSRVFVKGMNVFGGAWLWWIGSLGSGSWSLSLNRKGLFWTNVSFQFNKAR